MYDRTHQLSHLGPQVCTVEVFLTTNSIALMDIRLVVWMSFGHLYLSRNLFISSNCRIYWHKVIHNILSFFFLTSIGSIVMFSHFLTLVICVIFFLDHSVLRFINFIVCVCFFQRTNVFVSLIFLYCFCFLLHWFLLSLHFLLSAYLGFDWFVLS